MSACSNRTVAAMTRALASAVLALMLGACAHGRLPELQPEQWHEAPRWPLPPAEPRIVWVGEIRSSQDILGSRGLFGWLADTVLGSSTEGTLDRPVGLAVDKRGRLLVADPGLQALVIFDPASGDTTVVRETINGPLVSPIGVVTDGDNNIYVSDSARAWVACFDQEGRPTRLIGEGELQRPTGLAIWPQRNELLVVDTGAHQMVVFDLQGTAREVLARRGTGSGELNFPVFATTTADGHAWVVDTMNARVQQFDRAGRGLMQFGQRGDSAGAFANPRGIAVDSDGHIYVSDTLFDNVQIFDRDGRLLLYFGKRGYGAGELWLPEGLVVDADDRIYVADALNHRVQIFRYLSRDEP